MTIEEDEDNLLRSAALENARSIRLARDRAEQELVKTQEALRENETWLHLALASADMGTWRVDLSKGLATRDANLNRLMGFSTEELVVPVDDRFKFVHPEDREATNAAWEKAIETKDTYEAEFRVVQPDGTLRWLRAQGRYVPGMNGSPDFITGVTVDITSRKQSQQERATLAAIVESSDDAIVSKDLNGVITSWNRGAEELFGYTPAEAIGRPVSMLIPEDRLNEEPSILERIRRGIRIEHYETIRRRKDGTLLDISLSVSPINDARGRIIGASKIARDISRRKQAEAELQELMIREQDARAEAESANRVKDEFLAMVSHELRTPLNAVVGWTQLLKSGKLDQAQTERAIQTIDRNAKAQVTIINELLDISRIISGKLKLDIESVNLASVISAAVDVVRPAADAKGIEIDTSLDHSAGTVSGEPVRLQQVIWNLLTNAVKFTPRGGRVNVQLQRSGSQLLIEVTDSGMGISADFLPHIFDRFQQADTSAKRSHGGLGLGLSIARNLVEMHGGSIQAESGGEGQGARFTVNLPIMAISDLTIAGRQSRSSPPRAAEDDSQDLNIAPEEPPDIELDLLSGLKVLAVDDQTDTRDLIVVALTRYGAEVRAAKSAGEALKLIQEWAPDVLVSDIGMPEEDGYDLMREIRALEPQSGGRIPAVALTGFAGAADESKAKAAGYQMHMTKPVALRELATKIAKLSGR